MAFGIYQLYQLIQPGFRKRRIQWFIQLFHPDEHTKILDVGGFVTDWDDVVPIASPLTILNLYHPPRSNVDGRFTLEVGDARRLPYPDRSFAIAYSNSVIEHLATLADQQRFAAEIRRVGGKVFVQTPNRWFFIESHFLTLFVHYLPWRISRRLIRYCSFRGLFRSGDNVDLQKLAAELRLLDYREMQRLFPDCEIHREKWLGLTKSLIAVRREAPE
jgi:SAM-dependent methyltransferase